MKIISLLSVIMALLLQNLCLAQNADKEVIMTVAGRNVEAGEFIRMFNKNLDPGNKTDVDTFLKQFIDFKLKVADAISEGYDTAKTYKDELNGYRNQLAQSYLTDPDVKDKLVKQAYERSLFEVKASHILISCAPGASPGDTAKAYAKAMEARKAIMGGEQFEKVAREISDDKSVQINNGNLGYFTVFQMITPFEEAAYNLEPGTISMPVRTSFGYHLIMVADKRPSRGKIKVAHIMKAAPPGSNDTIIQKAKTEIDRIYTLLRSGSSFRELALKYSDHKESGARGGEMNMFGAGEIIPDFAEAAFAIRDTGQYTEPVRTIYGYHIIKLLQKQPPASFQEARPYLESKLNQADLNSFGKKSFIARLKKEYNFRLNPEIYKWFTGNTDSLIMSGKARFDRKRLPPGNIYSFANQFITASEFAGFIEENLHTVPGANPDFFISSLLESNIDKELVSYEDSILEQKYPDFRYLMNEFHDGILLFEISSKKVWNIVQEDSTGLKQYYDLHKDNFKSRKRIEAKIYSLKSGGGMEELEAAYREYSVKPDADKQLSERFNRTGDTMLFITEGKWSEGDDQDLDKIHWTTGVQSLIKNGMPSVIVINKITEPSPQSFDEAKTDVLSEYQDWLTEEWIRQLTEKYTVKIDNNVFEEVKERINNE